MVTKTTSQPRHQKTCPREHQIHRSVQFYFTMVHSTIALMARGKGKTIPIKLLSSAGTGFFYTTRKNVSNTQHKIAFVKYDPIVQKRVLFKEHKIK